MKEVGRQLESELARRIGVALFVRHVLLACVAGLSAWGASVLVLRLAVQQPHGKLWWGALVVVPCVAYGVVRSWLGVPARQVLRAVLDARNRFGGLLMASAEADVTAWFPAMPKGTAPRVTMHDRRLCAMCLLSLAFALMCLLLPDRAMIAGGSVKMEIGPVVKELEQQIETLQEQKLMEEKTAEELEQALNQAWQESDRDDPARTWEALDHVQQKLEHAAKASAEETQRTLDAVEKAKEAAEACAASQQSNGASTASSRLPQAAAQLLADLLKQLATQDAAGLSNALAAMDMPREMKEALEAGMAIDPATLSSLSPEQMSQLASKLGAFAGGLTNALMKLGNARLVNLGDLKFAQPGAG